MTAGLLLTALLVAAPAPAPSAIEARAAEQVVSAIVAAKLPAPARDPSLSLAARALAERILGGKLEAPGLAAAVPGAISAAGGWDPAPRTILLTGRSADAILKYLRGQASLTEERSDAMGVGVAQNAGKIVLLVVVGRRFADVEAFPRALPVGASAGLQAQLRAPLTSPQLVVTAPDGRAETSTDAQVDGTKIRATLHFASAGRYAVEVVGRSKEGPRVAALFQVHVGDAPVAAELPDPPEPRDPIAKVEAVLSHMNRVRARAHLPALAHDHQLDILALEHAEDMADNHFFAHVSPTRGDLHHRLAGRYAYVRAGENLGEAGGALAAERAIEASPAHLENLLDHTFTRVGVALYPNRHPGGEVTLLLAEIFASPPEKLPDPSNAIYAAINRGRRSKHLAVLGRDPDLDALARRHLAGMVRQGVPGGAHDLEDEALGSRNDLDSVAVDLFVGSKADDALRSQNALSHGFNRVGVAASLVSNTRYGSDRLWICVIYGRVGG